MKQNIATTALLALALSACQQNDPNNIAIDEGNSLNAQIEYVLRDALRRAGRLPTPGDANPPASDEEST